jgi:hypothetical protein
MSRMLKLLLVSSAWSHDTYTEKIHIGATEPLGKTGLVPVRFEFEIATASSSSHLLDLFPQPVASVLIANRGSVQSLRAKIARGRWRQNWGPKPEELYSNPTGSSMILETKPGSADNETSTLWTQSGWLFSTILGASFESLAPEQKSFYWITPMDVSDTVRVGSNPNEPLCSDNIRRLVQLLPCRDRTGLGKSLIDLSLPMARSEYFEISIEARNFEPGPLSVLTGSVFTVLAAEDASKAQISLACPASLGGTVQVPERIVHAPPISVKRSMVGSRLGAERRYGTLLIVIENTDSVHAHSVEVHDQLPFFLVPLARTSQNFPKLVKWSDLESDAPTYLAWNLTLGPGQMHVISIDVYKRFLPMWKFSYSFEKGFDMSSAVYRVDNAGDWHLTRGLVVIVPLPDQTSTFNAMAVAVTPIALFFGIVFRAFVDKRSDIVDERKAAERDPPLFRLARFIWQRIKKS